MNWGLVSGHGRGIAHAQESCIGSGIMATTGGLLGLILWLLFGTMFGFWRGTPALRIDKDGVSGTDATSLEVEDQRKYQALMEG